jgi:RimJ/RimL family protein N-acetyltransferase
MNTEVITTLPVITTERLVINALTLEDIKPFFAYRTNPKVLQYQGEFPRSKTNVRELIETQNKVDFGTVNQWFQFAIRLLSDNTLIGDIGLHFNSPFISQVEIAYSIMPSFQHKGYASESVQTLIDYCFTTLQMKAITATIDVRNIASRHLLLKLGFMRMAFRPHACFLRGEWCDEEDYALFSK